MKILWLSPTPSLGENYINKKPVGTGWIKSLEKGIKDKVDLSVVFFHEEEMAPFTLGKTKYYPVTRFQKGKLTKIARRILNTLESPEDIQRFQQIIDEVKPDLIHIHGTEGPYGLIQKHTDIPCVVSIQGIISVVLHRYFTGTTYATVLKHSRLKDWLFFRTFIHTYYYYLKTGRREKDIFESSRHVIGRTAWDRRVSSVLAPTARYHHNDEILRDAFYTMRWDNELQGKMRIFTTTGPVIYKGLETILQAAHLLDLNGIDYEWEIAGLEEDDAAVILANKTAKRQRGRNVRFVGRLSEHQLLDKLQETHLYVSASHIENSPNSLCEAMILGIPCIATNAGGTASLLEDGKEGILIQDGDPFSMAGAVLELAKDYDRAKALGWHGRQQALKRHDPDKIVEDLLRIYQVIANVSIDRKAGNFAEKI